MDVGFQILIWMGEPFKNTFIHEQVGKKNPTNPHNNSNNNNN